MPSTAGLGKPHKVLVLGALPDSLVNFRGPLLQEMVRRGHAVTAAAAAADPLSGMAGVDVRERLRGFGVHFREVPIDRAGADPAKDIALYSALKALMRELRPDVVLSYTAKPVIYGTMAAKAAGVPHRFALITGAGSALLGGRRPLVRRVLRILYKRALAATERVIFQNPDDLHLFHQVGLLARSHPTLIMNGSGVDLEQFQPQPWPLEPMTFLLIARLLGDKGIREYVEAARIVHKHEPGARFLLVGPEDRQPNAIKPSEIAAWRASGDVEVLGGREDVRPALAAASVYVLPSYREGTPRTVLEAMACARPIITTDAPGCRETVEDGVNGRLVPVKNAADLAQAMLGFIRSPDLVAKMGTESLRIAREKYEVGKVNDTLLTAMRL